MWVGLSGVGLNVVNLNSAAHGCGSGVWLKVAGPPEERKVYTAADVRETIALNDKKSDVGAGETALAQLICMLFWHHLPLRDKSD